MLFKIGDLVRHKSEFLRNIFWVLDVPLNGKIATLEGGSIRVALVNWSDGTSTRVLVSNLEADPRS